MTTRELAKIVSTFLGVEDHGIFTATLQIRYEGGGGQGIGGYALDEPVRDADDKFVGRVGTAEGAEFVKKTIDTVGASSWEDLPGKMLYVVRESESLGAKVIGIEGLGFNGKKEPFVFGDLWGNDG